MNTRLRAGPIVVAMAILACGEERLLPVGGDCYRVSVVLQRTGETGTLEFEL